MREQCRECTSFKEDKCEREHPYFEGKSPYCLQFLLDTSRWDVDGSTITSKKTGLKIEIKKDGLGEWSGLP